MLRGRTRVDDAQVGVGHLPYLRPKIRKSKATRVIINSEAREQLKGIDPWAYERTSDRLQFGETSSKPLSAGVAEGDAATVLHEALCGSDRLSERFKLAVASGVGLQAAAASFARSLLFSVVHRWANDQPLDGAIVDQAIDTGIDSFLKAGVHSYIVVNDFLAIAGALFDGRLIRAVGGKIAVAGVIADVVVSTARDLIAHIRGRITFAQLLSRALIATVAAAGSLGGFAIALKVSAGLPPWLQLVLTIGLTWAGGWAGSRVGKELFAAPTRAPRAARWPAGGYIKI
jgi:hypothetical protein